jgi:hypothetical protein
MRTNRFVHVFKNKKGMRVIRIEMGVFDIWVLALVGPEKNLEGFVRWNYNKPEYVHELSEYSGHKGMCLKPKGCAPAVWIPRKPRTPEEYGTLAHECTHAAIHVMEWIGMPINNETSELLTHTVAWLVDNILEHA